MPGGWLRRSRAPPSPPPPRSAPAGAAGRRHYPAADRVRRRHGSPDVRIRTALLHTRLRPPLECGLRAAIRTLSPHSSRGLRRVWRQAVFPAATCASHPTRAPPRDSRAASRLTRRLATHAPPRDSRAPSRLTRPLATHAPPRDSRAASRLTRRLATSAPPRDSRAPSQLRRPLATPFRQTTA
jgi:hypothetical protein